MRLTAVMATLMLLGGCNLADRQRADNVSGNGSAIGNAVVSGLDSQSNNSVAPVDPNDNGQLAVAAAAPRDPNAVDREWFAGLWTDTGDCADAGQFGSDGRYRLADNTRGMWNVQDGQLVIENAGGRRSVRLRKIANDTVETIAANGQASRSTRCARITPRAAPPVAATPTLPTPTVAPPPADIAD